MFILTFFMQVFRFQLVKKKIAKNRGGAVKTTFGHEQSFRYVQRMRNKLFIWI